MLIRVDNLALNSSGQMAQNQASIVNSSSAYRHPRFRLCLRVSTELINVGALRDRELLRVALRERGTQRERWLHFIEAEHELRGKILVYSRYMRPICCAHHLQSNNFLYCPYQELISVGIQ